MKSIKDSSKPAGFFRLNIVEEKSGRKMVVGDSGWCKNTLTNLGVQHYMVERMASIAGSMVVSYAGMGSSGSVQAADTNISSPAAVNRNSFAVVGSVQASRTLRYTGSVQSNIYPATTIANVGLFADSATTNATGSIFCGQTFASSALATNQAVNLTYDIQFP
jgi:hypothetical protein